MFPLFIMETRYSTYENITAFPHTFDNMFLDTTHLICSIAWAYFPPFLTFTVFVESTTRRPYMGRFHKLKVRLESSYAYHVWKYLLGQHNWLPITRAPSSERSFLIDKEEVYFLSKMSDFVEHASMTGNIVKTYEVPLLHMGDGLSDKCFLRFKMKGSIV